MSRWASLIVLIIIGSIGYSLLWYSYAHRLERRVTEQFIALQEQGYTASSDKIDVSGFPYRLVITLEGAEVISRSGQLSATAKKASFISHLWSLNHWVMQLDDVTLLARQLPSVRAPAVSASWRELDGLGQRLVLSTRDHAGVFIGNSTKPIALSALGLDIPSAEARATQPALFADATARFGIGLEVDDSSWRIEGRWLGPVLADWSRGELARWRDAGGMLNIIGIDVRDSIGQLSGEGSLTVDTEIRPLATFNRKPPTGGSGELPSATPAIITQLLVHLASEPINTGDISFITVQNGSLMVNGIYAGDIEALPAPAAR